MDKNCVYFALWKNQPPGEYTKTQYSQYTIYYTDRKRGNFTLIKKTGKREVLNNDIQ